MKHRDYLWCVLQLMLDDEEALNRLCPSCRAQAQRETCPVCGAPAETVTGGENASFDWARFQALERGNGG